MTQHVYVKLGGALLTDKDRRESLRADVLQRLVREIRTFVDASSLPLIVAHGSGSFAHVAARESGFLTCPSPHATALVAAAARRLNVHVVDALLDVGLAALPLPAAALAHCEDGAVVEISAAPIVTMLRAGVLPVIYGDAVPDSVRGGTILSTEPLIAGLIEQLPATRVVLATDVDGVFAADPHESASARKFASLTPSTAAAVAGLLSGAGPDATDVTGGMATKVARMAELVRRHPELTVRILSGLRPGAVLAALSGESSAGGTLIHAE